MSTINDGGPAFPFVQWRSPDGMMSINQSGGMSLRDYFAIHADQPGASEIATAAGFVYSSGGVWSDMATRVASFDDWWRGLDQKRRFELSAQVRYGIADAMIAERAKGGA